MPSLVVLAAVLHLTLLMHETGRMEDDAGLSAIRLPDERNAYLYCANAVVERGWAFLKDEASLRSPPLPWVWLLIWGRNIALTRFANIALAIVGSLLVAGVVRDKFGDRVALLAFVLCAGGYQVVLYSGTVLTEPLAVFLASLLLWALHRAMTTARTRYVVLAGIACGLLTLARPSLQLFPVALLGAWFLAQRLAGRNANHGRRRVIGARPMLLLLACYLAVVAPWVIKNYLALGVLRISNGFGAVMYLGSDLRTNGDEPIFSGMQWQTSVISRPYNHLQIQGGRRLLDAALDNIRRHPLAWIRLGLSKIGRTLIGGPNWHFFPADHYKAKARSEGRGLTAIVFAWWTVCGTFVALFGLAGLALMLRERHAIAIAGLVLVVYLLTLHAITYAMPRFGVPFYPALVLGCCGYSSARRRRLVTSLLVILCAAIPAYLALRYYVVPRCVVGAKKLDYFTIDRGWDVPPPDQSGAIVIDAAGIVPPFNGCIFIDMTVKAEANASKCFGTLSLRPAGRGEFDECSALWFPLIGDGRPHVYQLCVELQDAWRGKRWDALKLIAVPPGATDVHVRHLTLAH